MSAETLVNAALIGDAALTAVVSTNNIASDYISQEYGLPAIVTNRSGTSYTNTIHDGFPIATDATVDCVCLSLDRAEVDVIADLVVQALAVSGFLIVDRSQEYDEETKTFITTVTCQVLL